MPRNGSGVMSKPSGTTAVPGTPIESAKFNAVVDDLIQDANFARPMTAGGTGAGTQPEAIRNMSGAYTTKNANYKAVLADIGATHSYIATGLTVSFDAASVLGTSWYYTAVADGFDIILDPDGSELINGATTLVIPNSRRALVICTGTAFKAFVSHNTTPVDALLIKTTLVTATNAAFALQSRTRFFSVQGVGGGGGGGGVGNSASQASAAGGGSSGLCGWALNSDSILIARPAAGTLNISIGAAGAAGAAGNNNGGVGGDTTVNDGTTTWAFRGGLGGVGTLSSTGNTVPVPGAVPAGHEANILGSSNPGGDGVFLAGSRSMSGDGASSPLGRGGDGRNLISVNTAAGVNGAGYGSGGSGAAGYNAAANVAGGAGAPGAVLILEYS